MRTNFILVDYENVQAIGSDVFEVEGIRIVVFLGPTVSKLPVDLVVRMQGIGGRGAYVQVVKQGPNALDLAMAFELGELVRLHQDAYFHIISKDRDFAALVAQLKTKGVFAARHEAVVNVPFVRAAMAKTVGDRANIFAERLEAQKATRPKSVATLTSFISRVFPGVTAEVSEALIDVLIKRGVLTVQGSKVSYPAA